MTDFNVPHNTSGHAQDNGSACPECGGAVRSEIYNQTFPYGTGDDFVELTAAVALRVCGACGFEFYDESAEVIRHEVVCQHLGVLTPKAIRTIREGYRLSRQQFARLTKLGEATIARWERGELIQNAANDRYLRLVALPSNFAILNNLATSKADHLLAAPIFDESKTQQPLRFHIALPLPATTKRFRSGISGEAFQAARENFMVRKAG